MRMVRQSDENAPEVQGREQPSAASKSARYVALHDVTEESSGRLNRIVRDLNRKTMDSIGQNLFKWILASHPSPAEKKAAVQAITGHVFGQNHVFLFTSSVTCQTQIYAAMKAKHQLEHSTYCSLDQMHQLTVAANAWFREKRLEGKYQLVEEHDLALVLGRPACRAGQGAASAPQSGIRSFFLQGPGLDPLGECCAANGLYIDQDAWSKKEYSSCIIKKKRKRNVVDSSDHVNGRGGRVRDV